MLLQGDTTTVAEFAGRTGWEVKPEGACKDSMCVPLPDDARDGDQLRIRVVAERLGMPVLEDAERGLLAVGPATVSGHALESAVAPDLELPDVDGDPFRLSSLHGKKVLLVAWASW